MSVQRESDADAFAALAAQKPSVTADPPPDYGPAVRLEPREAHTLREVWRRMMRLLERAEISNPKLRLEMRDACTDATRHFHLLSKPAPSAGEGAAGS